MKLLFIKKIEMNEDDLQLDLALSNNHNFGGNPDLSTKKKKRTFHESFSDQMSRSSTKRTLPLLIWGHNHDAGTESEDEIQTPESAVASRYCNLYTSLSLSRSRFFVADRRGI